MYYAIAWEAEEITGGNAWLHPCIVLIQAKTRAICDPSLTLV